MVLGPFWDLEKELQIRTYPVT